MSDFLLYNVCTEDFAGSIAIQVYGIELTPLLILFGEVLLEVHFSPYPHLTSSFSITSCFLGFISLSGFLAKSSFSLIPTFVREKWRSR